MHKPERRRRKDRDRHEFAGYCGRKGLRTLLVDLDHKPTRLSPVFRSTTGRSMRRRTDSANLFGVRSHTSAEGSQKSLDTIIRKEVWKNLDLIPSHIDLFTIDLELAGATARETKLRKALAPIMNEYDMIVCDCPPNLTIPTQNAWQFAPIMSCRYLLISCLRSASDCF